MIRVKQVDQDIANALQLVFDFLKMADKETTDIQEYEKLLDKLTTKSKNIQQIFLGGWLFVLRSFIFFIILQHLLSALAVRIDGDNPKLIAYSTFLVIGYKQIVDALLIKSALESIFHKKAIWTSAKRKGF